MIVSVMTWMRQLSLIQPQCLASYSSFLVLSIVLSFMVISIDSSSNELREFLTMIQQMVFSASFLLVVQSSSLSPVYHQRSSMCVIQDIPYISFSHRQELCLEYLCLLQILMISQGRQQIAMTPTNLLHTHIVFCRNFLVDSKMMVTSHPEAVRKLHAGHTYNAFVA